MAITGTGYWFHNAFSQTLQGNIKTSDALKMALLTTVPSLDSAVHWSDVSANEASGPGYTSGGNALASISVTVTAANSWTPTWAASTAYTVGQVVKPSSTGNGYLYRCVAAGTSGTTSPTFPTVYGQDVTDNTVTWVNCGTSITVFTAGAVSWTVGSGTLTANCAVIYDPTTGTATTEPLMILCNFGQNVSSSGGTYQVSPDPNLGFAAVTAP